MASKNTIQLLLDISRSGNKTGFLKLLNHSSILTMSPDYVIPKDVALLIISFATIKMTDEHHWRILENYFHLKKDEMNSHDLANCVWGFAKSPRPIQAQTWRSLELGVNHNLQSFNPKELSNICYAFAIKDNSSRNMWEQLKTATMRQINYLSAMDLPGIIWAFSKANVDDNNFWNMLEKKIIMEIKNFPHDSLGSVMYSLARQQKGSDALWNLFETIVQNNVGQFEDKSLMNIMWSLNKMGKGKDRLWEDISGKIRTNLANCNVSIAVNSLCALSKNSCINGELKQIIEESFNSDEKIQQMTYGSLINFSKLMYSEKINQPEVWDKLAMRLRQLIHEPLYYNFKVHIYFVVINPAYWNFVCEESFLVYFDRVAKIPSKNREKAIGMDAFLDVIDASFFCLYQKIGSYVFWKELSRFLQYKKDLLSLRPLAVAKYMLIVSRRLFSINALQSRWLTCEEEIAARPDLMDKFIADPKSCTVLLQACFSAERLQKILTAFEKRYKDIAYTDKELTDFLTKLAFERKDLSQEEKVLRKLARRNLIKHSYEEKIEIMRGVCEDWFNRYLNRDYTLNPTYINFIETTFQKKVSSEEVIKDEAEDSDLAEAKEILPPPDETLETPDFKEVAPESALEEDLIKEKQSSQSEKRSTKTFYEIDSQVVHS